MPNKKKMFTQQKASQQDARPNIYYKFEGRPSPREVKSQVAQQKSNTPGTRKDVKLKIDEKLN